MYFHLLLSLSFKLKVTHTNSFKFKQFLLSPSIYIFKNQLNAFPYQDHPDGRVFGYSDLLRLDGKPAEYEPFWFRTFRFIELEIQASPDSPVTFDVDAVHSGFQPVLGDDGPGLLRLFWRSGTG
jgi:hypothetical protein